MPLVRGSKEEKTVNKTKKENLALKAAVVAQAPVQGSSVDLSEQQQKVMGLLLKQLETAAVKEDQETAKELKKLQKRLKAQGAASDAKNAQIRSEQNACSHLNRGEPRTGGQWNSDGHYSVFCLNCFKLWSSAEKANHCPPNLFPEFMGGAVLENVNRVSGLTLTEA